MSNICYLTGAGASIARVPAVNRINSEFAKFVEEIEKYYQESFEFRNKITTEAILNPVVTSARDEEKLFADFVTEARALSNEILRHATVDTFAKKLSLRGDFEGLRKLKIVFSLFLIYQQTKVNSYRFKESGEEPFDPVLDPRYDTFFASVLERGTVQIGDEPFTSAKIPESIKFLTWNYDFQFEKSYYGFIDRIDGVKQLVTDNTSQFLKINGSCLFPDLYTEKKEARVNSLITRIFQGVLNLEDIFLMYHLFSSSHNVPLTFSWDQKTDIQKRMKPFEDVEVLVVVGYSFPYFNKEVDREILRSMPNLRTIYLQVHENDYGGVESRLWSILENFIGDNKSIEKVSDLTSFFIPDTFTPSTGNLKSL